MKIAQGAMPAKEFSRRRGFKFTRHAEAMNSRESRQPMSASNWGTGVMANTPQRIDGYRVQVINWPGLCGVQQACGLYDPKPRLVKKGSGR